MEALSNMNQIQLMRYFQKLNIEQVQKLLLEKEQILTMEISKLNLLFLNINNECKKLLLNDQELFNHLMTIPVNRMGKSIIDLSDQEIREYIYNHANLLNSIQGKKVVEAHLRKLNVNDFSTLLSNENLNQVFFRDIAKEVKQQYPLTPYQNSLLETSISNGTFSNIALFKINNSDELMIYMKYGLIVEVQNKKDGELFIAGEKIRSDFVERANRKHIITLLDLIKQKEENLPNNQLFIGIMKLYMVFGLDNSKKVIEDFFTYSTKASIRRASDELFKDTRREFRLKNQNKFYYYGIEKDFEQALRDNNYEFFTAFCGQDKTYVEKFLESVRGIVASLEEKQRTIKIKNIVLDEINKREQFYYQLDMQKYQKYYQSIARTSSIKLDDIYQLFGSIDLNYKLNKDGKLIADPELTKFLLGNCKRDNDCLLRMVLNKQVLGLNDELYKVMNHFEKIRAEVKKEKHLSIYSVLDVIDISKVFLYNLKPDELDITLATLSKILKSRKYCTEPPEIIVKRVMQLHKDRKKKIACAIPMMKGRINGDIEANYKVAEFDDEELLVSGIDSGSCFKVGGKGEDFFHFCLTNPKGLVFYIEYNNIKYVLPATINGNMLNINSIDPRIEDENLYQKLIIAIKEIAKIIVQDPINQIELVTITDIHHEKFMSEKDYEKILFEKFIPLNTDVYCDYNKKEVTNYILYRKDSNVQAKYLDNQDLFYQDRPSPYIFSPSHEYDQERIEIVLNQIAYSSIDFLDIPENKKQEQREFYQLIEVSNFLYIVGNKDWFIGLTKKQEIIKKLLPYDPRGIKEFQKYQETIYDVLGNMDYQEQKKHMHP